jgi:hypothetical protein
MMSEATFACLTLTVLPIIGAFYVLTTANDKDDERDKGDESSAGCYSLPRTASFSIGSKMLPRCFSFDCNEYEIYQDN